MRAAAISLGLVLVAGTVSANTLIFELPIGSPPQTKFPGKLDVVGVSIGLQIEEAKSLLEREGYYCRVNTSTTSIVVKGGMYRGSQNSTPFVTSAQCVLESKGEYQDEVYMTATSPLSSSTVQYIKRYLQYAKPESSPSKNTIMTSIEDKYNFKFSKVESNIYSYTVVQKNYGNEEIDNKAGYYGEGKLYDKYKSDLVEYAFNAAVFLYSRQGNTKAISIEMYDNALVQHDKKELEATRAKLGEVYASDQAPDSGVAAPKL